jgi:hypothetical protein
MSKELLEKVLGRAWSVSIKHNRDNTIRRIDIVLKDTVTSSPAFTKETIKLLEEFVKTSKGAF